MAQDSWSLRVNGHIHQVSAAADTPLLYVLQNQLALVAEQAPQCGYCMNGIVVKAAELLANNPRPTAAEIRTAMNGHLYRCGAYPSILRAIQKAAQS